jgi:hypothetical protein
MSAAQNFSLHNTLLFYRLRPDSAPFPALSRVHGFPAGLALLSAPWLARPFLAWLVYLLCFLDFLFSCFVCPYPFGSLKFPSC